MEKHTCVAKLCALILISIAVTSCGGESDSNGNQPKVTYSDRVAAGAIENYMNADWLFQNYLGDYGVPEQVKPQFLPALKLLANGFALQLKTGQDVKTNIEQVHAMFLQYIASGEGTQFFAQLQARADDPAAREVTRKIESDDSFNPYFVEPVISPEDQAAIAAAKLRDEAERVEIQRIIREYGLPYHIEETPEQWFIYSPAMKGGGKGGGGGGDSQPSTHGDIRTWGWRRGDMVWTNGTGSIPGVPGHNAIVWGERTEVYLIDANTDVGVSMATNIQKWFDRYSEVRALTPRLNWSLDEYNCYVNYGAGHCRKDSWQRINAWWFADRQRGKPYNWNFSNPRDTARFYCSSLLWNAYASVGFNILSPWSLGPSGMITPNQIRDSSVISAFRISTKS